MRDAIVILGGAADRALDDLDGLSPLGAATTPNLDRLAELGRVGTALHVPHGYAPVREVSVLSLLSYDPARWSVGCSTAYGSAQGIAIDDEDWWVCVGAVSVDDHGRLVDPDGGCLNQAEMRSILVTLAEVLGQRPTDFEGAPLLSFHALQDGRGLVVCESGLDAGRCDVIEPELIVGKSIGKHLPKGGSAGALFRAIVEQSGAILASHDVTALRRELDERLPTHLWFWGAAAGRELGMERPEFSLQQGASAALSTGTLSVAGLARLHGIDVIAERESEGELDAVWSAMTADARREARAHDLLIVHLDAFEALSHDGDTAGKIAALESADRCVIGPIMEQIGVGHGDRIGRVMVACDHVVQCRDGQHAAQAVPFVMAGDDVACISHQERFDEPTAAQSDLHVEHGADLMEYFLYSGRRGVPGRSKTITR